MNKNPRPGVGAPEPGKGAGTFAGHLPFYFTWIGGKSQ
nr:MAG TPA: hypothetical protein [Caudoviricetes sp.]